MKYNKIQGRYLPDCFGVEQKRLHRKANFSYMKVTEDSQFSNSVKVKFYCVFGHHGPFPHSCLASWT